MLEYQYLSTLVANNTQTLDSMEQPHFVSTHFIFAVLVPSLRSFLRYQNSCFIVGGLCLSLSAFILRL